MLPSDTSGAQGQCPSHTAASKPFQEDEEELPLGLDGNVPLKGLFLPVPCPPQEPSTEPQGPWPCDALPSGGAERAAADSLVTAAMPGMWTPPPKWRPAARAGSITGSVARALVHQGRKMLPDWDGWKPQEPSCPIPVPPVLSWHPEMSVRQPAASHTFHPILGSLGWEWSDGGMQRRSS